MHDDDYVEKCVAECEKRFNLKISALRNTNTLNHRSLIAAIDERNKGYDIRLSNMNEWREQNRDIISKFVSKQEMFDAVARIDASNNGRFRLIETLLYAVILTLVAAGAKSFGFL